MDDTAVVSIKNWTNCPFRGLPHISLDYRCPSTLRVWCLPVELRGASPEITSEPRKRGRPRKDEVREIVVKEVTAEMQYVPMLGSESVCRNCLDNRTREKEMGMSISVRNTTPHKKGKR